jgi:hypothetical protein
MYARMPRLVASLKNAKQKEKKEKKKRKRRIRQWNIIKITDRKRYWPRE